MTTPDANSSVTVNTLSNALAVAIQQASSASATVAGNQQHHGSGGATRPVPATTSVANGTAPQYVFIEAKIQYIRELMLLMTVWVRVDVGVFYYYSD